MKGVLDPFESPAAFRRAVEIIVSPGRAATEVEDNFHHFRVSIDHANGTITGLEAEAVRVPWSLCPLAVGELQQMVGTPLSVDQVDIASAFSIRDHCTHLFDLAILAISAAARGGTSRRYDLAVSPPDGNWLSGYLRCSSGRHLQLDVRDGIIMAPVPYAGVSVKRGFPEWAARNLCEDEYEAALLLRRGIFLGSGRRNLDSRPTAAEGSRNLGGCFVMQPSRAHEALRIVGSTWDFPKDGRPPLSR